LTATLALLFSGWYVANALPTDLHGADMAKLLAPAALWPWKLTAQAVGAWLVGIGLTAAQVVYENDWRRVRLATDLYVVFLYVVFLASMLAVGVYSFFAARRARTALY
jgi:hypothetical protein